MGCVRPALGNYAELAARPDAVLRAIKAGLHFELLHRVGTQVERHLPQALRHDAAVQEDDVVGLTLPADVEGRTAAKSVAGGSNARDQRCKPAQNIPPIEGQTDDFRVVDHLSDFRCFRVEDGSFGAHGNALCQGADLQNDVDAIRAPHFEFEAGANLRTKTAGGYLQGICVDRQIADAIVAAVRRHGAK